MVQIKQLILTLFGFGLNLVVLAQSGTIITNIQLVDGTGKPAFKASVRIVGNKIVAIGNLKPNKMDQIIDGKQKVEDSPLRQAPHTIGAISATNWDRNYSREAGAFPATNTGLIPGELIGSRGKYWPTVGRIDGAFGDRNLVCSCAPIEAYSS